MQAEKMFSKVTITSGRTLLSVASVTVASRVFDFKLKQLPLIAQSGFETDQLLKLAVPLIAFLMIAHYFNWSSDHSGHQFDRYTLLGKKFLDPGFADGRNTTLTEKAINIAQQKLNMTEKQIESSQYAELVDQLKIFNRRFNHFRIFSNLNEYLAFYGQHFVLPVGVAIWAICIAVHSFI